MHIIDSQLVESGFTADTIVVVTSLFTPILSATTFYGDGSNLTGITGVSANDFYTTGTTLLGNIVYFHRSDSLSAYTVDLTTISASGGTSRTNGYMPQGW